MITTRTTFSAQAHGYKFINRFTPQFPTTVPFAIFGQIDLKAVTYGLCGGMCFGALDYFYAHRALPDYAEPDALPFRYELYLWDRQIDSLLPLTIPLVLEWMHRDDLTLAARCARYEVPKLRRALDKGKPVVLALIRARYPENPTLNHQVLATGYDFDEANKGLVIYLYDPNHPGETPTLSLNLQRPSQGIQLAQSTGEKLRGFFVIPHRAEAPPA
jgi:hypothetical protein